MPISRDRAFELVDALSKELGMKRPIYTAHTNYYRGLHPLKFASEQHRKHFSERYRGFSDNWVQVISDSASERLDVTGFKFTGDDKADDDLWRVVMENGLDEDMQLGFTNSINTGRTFCLVWGNPDDEDTPDVSFLDSSQALVAYEPGSRRKRYAAINCIEEGDHERVWLFTRDEAWQFVRTKSQQKQSPQISDAQQKAMEWELIPHSNDQDAMPNPMGLVPIIEFPNRPMLADEPISDIHGTIAMQDAINLTWSQLFVTMDFASFPQRLMLGAEAPKVPILDETGQQIGERAVDLDRFAVDRILWVEPNEDGHVPTATQWEAAKLDVFTGVLEQAVNHLAAQTRTPPHYLIGQIVNISGDALIAAESGLVQKVKQKQVWFGAALREVFKLICLAQGNESKAKSVATGRVMWADPATNNSASMAATLTALKAVGFPFEYIALRYGLSPAEVADVMDMKEAESQLDPMMQAMTGGAVDGNGNPVNPGQAAEGAEPTDDEGRDTPVAKPNRPQ